MKRAQGFRSLIMGPPGGGKGYISHKIVQTFNAVHISTGDMLRHHIRHRTPIGKEAQGYTTKGKLVPDHLLTDMVREAIQRVGERSYILDGYPRNIKQSNQLDSFVKMDFALNLDMPHHAIVGKLKNRMIHPPSGRVYNKGVMAPKVSNRDDVTGDPLVRREDDAPDVVLSRLLSYSDHMNPVIKHYQNKFILQTIFVRRHENLWPLVKRFIKRRWKQRIPRPPGLDHGRNFQCRPF